MPDPVEEAVAAARRSATPPLAAALAFLDAEPDAAPEAVSAVYQALLADPADRRRRAGAYYTPPAVVAHLLDLALDPVLAAVPATALPAFRVVDPCCGAGHFLLAAWARVRVRLRAEGLPDPDLAAARCLVGTDTDPDALTLAARLLDRAAGRPVSPSLRATDSLLDPPTAADVVVGNPPFLNQLARRTAHSRARAEALKTRFPGLVAPYTDPAWLHLVAALRGLRPGGRVGLVLPRSFLAARDARPVREAVAEEGRVLAVWDGREAFPGVGVRVCGVVVGAASPGAPPQGPIRSTLGLPPVGRPDAPPPPGGLAAAPSWASLLPAVAGLPRVHPRTDGTLADLATATADFRDEYYGLVPFVVDRAEADEARFPRLLTTGLVDAARSRWGEIPTRFARARWAHPRVDRARLAEAPRVAAWAARRLRPKILVATQTKILEALADPEGAWLTVTPLISVFPAPERFWHVAAALLSPVATSWAATWFAGAALSADTLKLSAGQVTSLPLPPPGPAWDAAARAVAAAHAEPHARLAHLADAAAAMDAAYGIDDPALRQGWLERLRAAP